VRFWVAACFALGLGAWLPAAALAEESAPPTEAAEAAPAPGPAEDPLSGELKGSIRIVQQRPFLHAPRVEVQVGAGLGVNDTMFQHYLLTATGRLHLTEAWSVAATYEQYFGLTSTLYEQVTESFEVFPEPSLIKLYAGLDAAYAPIYGKLTWFGDAVVHFDLYLLVGGGITLTSRHQEPKPTFTFGAGWRVIATRWLTASLEIKDHLFVERFNAGPEVTNNVTFVLGFSVFLPPDHEYKYPR
jgi:outer membrane beta-barrel protein